MRITPSSASHSCWTCLQAQSLYLRTSTVFLVSGQILFLLVGCQRADLHASCCHALAELVKPYPLEEHFVTTEDGFILGLYRIPHGLPPGQKKRSVELQPTSLPIAFQEFGRRFLHPAHPAASDDTAVEANSGADDASSHRPVVLLQHGLLDSCAGFLLQGHDHALAFLLADAGELCPVFLCFSVLPTAQSVLRQCSESI